MPSKIIHTGDKIKVTAFTADDKIEKEAFYISRVVEVMGSNKIKAVMPVKNGKYAILDSLIHYTLEFITRRGIYECKARIVKRFKEKVNYFVVFELMSELEKVQRREYYRLDCILDIKFRRYMDGNLYDNDEPEEKNENQSEEILDNNENDKLSEEEELELKRERIPWHAAIVTNISGGGVRFNSREALNKGENVLLRMHLKFDDGEEDYEIPAKVVFSGEIPNRPDIFEARVQFTDISSKVREDIIRFVFDEERRIRRRKKGLV